jgi:glycine cleavage system H lipoate-binding protein
MDDFALRLLGPLDRIEAPLMGKEVRQDRADISVFRELEQAKVLSPVSGVVTSVNTKLREQGRLASEDPFSEGWIMRVHSKDLRQDLKNLMLNEETREFIDEQAEQLYRLIDEVGGPLTADGGYLAHDLYGNMPELGWKRLTRLFLGN